MLSGRFSAHNGGQVNGRQRLLAEASLGGSGSRSWRSLLAERSYVPVIAVVLLMVCVE